MNSFVLLNNILPLFGNSTSIFTDIALRVSDQTVFLLNLYVLVSAVLVSVITTGLVFKNARHMKGGVFGTVLQHFGTGMLLILLGFFFSTLSFSSNIFAFAAESLHAILYIVGYVIMAIAAHKLLEAIQRNQ